MNQPARTFTLIGLVTIILLAFHLLPTITIADTELRAVNILSDVLPEVYRQKYAIDVIPRPEPPKRRQVAVDSTRQQQSRHVEEYKPEGVTLIDDYGDGQPGGMDHFYHMLDQRNTLGRPVRIAYFGDSFIEGDILTAHLRQRLQQKFGGCGVGWVDPGNKINGFRQTVVQRFRLFDEYEVVTKPFNYSAEGINQRYFIPQEGASVWTRGTDYCSQAKTWQQSTLYLRTSQGVTVSVNQNDEEWVTQPIGPSAHLQTFVSTCDTTRCISYRFTDVTNGTYVYGMALEGRSGITLDNFSMRGSSGTSLVKMPADVLADFAHQRAYDLIVLHFGINVVSDRSHAANYKAYTRQMGNVIAHLREAYPEASILVVSVPDRCQRTAAGVRTINGIESLAAYQQIMASDSHVAYFNLFQAMGGRESMVRLVERGLANKDYTHLSHGGGKAVSQHLYRSLEAGYVNYQRHQAP